MQGSGNDTTFSILGLFIKTFELFIWSIVIHAFEYMSLMHVIRLNNKKKVPLYFETRLGK